MTTPTRPQRAPLSDAIAFAVAKLVDDAMSDKSREPTHADLDFVIGRCKLTQADPKTHGQQVGKAKRLRAVLTSSLESAPESGEALVAAVISMLRAKGGFRTGSPNYCGAEPITDAIACFHDEGFTLATDGTLVSTAIETLSGIQLTTALEAYVRRARRGSEDAALLVGTGKDLLEATAAHIITSVFGSYSSQANFPTLLGQAFTALKLATSQTPEVAGEPPHYRLERAMYEAGCAVNAFRNKQGTGHGRPWLPSVTDVQARASIQLMGIVSSFLLGALKARH